MTGIKSADVPDFSAIPLASPCSIAIRSLFVAETSNGGDDLVVTGMGGSIIVAVCC